MDADSLEHRTLEYLFNVQQSLSSSAKRTGSETSATKRVAAYYRWHLNNRIEQCEEEIGAQKKVPSVTVKGKRTELTDRCACCNSLLSQFVSIPKKLKHKKKAKRGTNYQTTLINARCGYCKASFKFNGLKKAPKVPVLPVRKSSVTGQSRVSIPSSSSRKASLTGLKTPTTSSTAAAGGKSHKEALQKLLSASKKQRSLDSKTRLSDFLSGCFK